MTRWLLLISALALTGCNSMPLQTSSQNSLQACPTSECGIASLPWQEKQRRQRQPLNKQGVETKQPIESIVREVYADVMATTDYVADDKLYGVRDIYPSRLQIENASLNGRYRGDCTTFSHRFYYALIDRGIHPSRILRLRMDKLRRSGKVTNHMAVLVDGKYLLDNAEPSGQVVHISQGRSLPKMWLSENSAGWYINARGVAPLADTRFKGFSLALH